MNIKIGVIGLGYVGLPIAIAAAKSLVQLVLTLIKTEFMI